MTKQTVNYSAFAKLLHWTIAILILTNYFLGLLLDRSQLYQLHKEIGFSILLLVVMRIIWRITHTYPDAVASISPLEKFLAKSAHKVLYLLMLIVPLSGWIMSNAGGHSLVYFGLNIPDIITKQTPTPADLYPMIHEVLANVFIAIICLHALGALKHHFIDKNTVLTRMLPSVRKRH